jgi:hypothetical protein
MPKFSLSSLSLRLLAVSLSLAATGCGDAEEKDDGGAADTSGSADTSDGSGSFVLPTDAEKATFEAATAANLTAAATLPLEDAAIYTFLEQILTDHPEVFGTTLAFDPTYATRPLAPYAYRGATGLLRKDLTLNGYDYANQPWFTQPVQTMAAVWSEPYFDAGGGEINMVTYSAPVVKDGVIIGVLTADFGPLATAP